MRERHASLNQPRRVLVTQVMPAQIDPSEFSKTRGRERSELIRQVVLTRPFLDLLDCSIRPAVAVAITPIALLQVSLVVAFQLTVELHAQHARLARL